MDAARRIVVSLPLAELWTDSGPLHAQRAERVGEAEIVQLLQGGSTFVVAAVGKPLQWVPAADRFTFWKAEPKCRLVPADVDSFDIGSYPGSYCYLASAWRNPSSLPIVVLEVHH
ncbi:hypothetical protein [Bradyrhizobium cosmicum]|uniref:Uncharacterized protein n=1 Tax=Bradyrhizobium cosmicum TaxID=1404864 RepID=A0AAI8QCB2_9BRAD|nr:hypothetical protein [Bradyrhizobium cosmicum]BAL76149.1 hypothetical protein S23_29410 [Bradyrhizobium cosmicum]